jgi:hypothetical protein
MQSDDIEECPIEVLRLDDGHPHHLLHPATELVRAFYALCIKKAEPPERLDGLNHWVQLQYQARPSPVRPMLWLMIYGHTENNNIPRCLLVLDLAWGYIHNRLTNGFIKAPLEYELHYDMFRECGRELLEDQARSNQHLLALAASGVVGTGIVHGTGPEINEERNEEDYIEQNLPKFAGSFEYWRRPPDAPPPY